MTLLINFATPNFQVAQQFNSKTGSQVGGFDQVWSTNLSNVDDHFKKQYLSILNQSRGAGYWLWKPYLILQALEQVQNGEMVMYCDSASHFIHRADPLLSLPSQFNQDVIPFELELLEASWTKRDAFVYMNADGQDFEKSPQFLASFIVIRKSAFSIEFVNEYLHYCCNPNILTDLENSCGLPNHPGFVAHRHDQSVFSLLCKKHGLKGFRDPSQWGNPRIPDYKNSAYPQILEHTRQKSPKHASPLYKLKRFFFPK